MGTLARTALSTGAAVVLLAGCGGSQQIGAPAAMPQSRVIAQHVARSGSWMLPEATSDDLLYYSNGYFVSVLTYPQGQLVGELTGTEFEPQGMCTDAHGNVFITSFGSKDIVEYAHGGTIPIAVLKDGTYNYIPMACSIDAVSGNLAVANSLPVGDSGSAELAIFQNAQGNPTFYGAPNIENFASCAFDSNGNLFADGYGYRSTGIAEMPEGSNSLSTFTVAGKPLENPGSIQWDGKYLTVASPVRERGPLPVYQIEVEGSSGTVVGRVNLHSSKHNRNSRYDYEQYWIQGDVIMGQNGRRGWGLGLWRYPSGGKPTAVFGRGDDVIGVTVSVAPSRSRVRK